MVLEKLLNKGTEVRKPFLARSYYIGEGVPQDYVEAVT